MLTKEIQGLLPDFEHWCIAVDHDGSGGEAAQNNSPEFRAFLQEILQIQSWKKNEHYTIEINDGSARQDSRLDELNLRHNAYAKGDQVYLTGSIFTSLERIKTELQKTLNHTLPETIKTSVTLSPLMTADLFLPKDLATLFPTKEIANQFLPSNLSAPTYYHIMKKAMRHSYKKKKSMPASYWHSSAPSRQLITEKHTIFDPSKLLSTWLQMQATANAHPGQKILYQLIDDKKEIGEALLKLFHQHPKLIPKNITFAFHQFDYYVKGFDENNNLIIETNKECYHPYTTEKGKPIHFVRGQGPILKNHMELAKRFALAADVRKNKTIHAIHAASTTACQHIIREMKGLPAPQTSQKKSTLKRSKHPIDQENMKKKPLKRTKIRGEFRLWHPSKGTGDPTKTQHPTAISTTSNAPKKTPSFGLK
jgi:hypothetical protein